MTTYATLDDMLLRFGQAEIVQLTDDEGTGTIAVARVDQAIATASTIVDGYVAAKYRTGAQPAPPLLVDLACDLARFRLYRGTAAPERVEKAHAAAIAMLKDIAKGTIKLDDGDGEGASGVAARPGAILVDRPARVFGRDDMAGY